MIVTAIEGSELAKAKSAFTTRRVPRDVMKTLISGDVVPCIGDVVLAVVDQIGSHSKIELPSGRRAHLSVGDRIIVAFGNRYAPDQFEAVVGNSLAPCHLVAAGGVAATKLCKHDAMRNPTQITPLGLIGDAKGERINLSKYAIPVETQSRQITTVFVAGTAMNAGKTMTSASLICGFAKAGYKVAGIKSTGTGAGGDIWFMSDMGAQVVLDFTDAGMPSTYLAPPELIERNVLGLIGHAAQLGCEIAVVEVADGLQHEETAELLRSAVIRNTARGIVFAASDALGAQAGVHTLQAWGHKVIALSGQFTRSPLAIREAEKSIGLPVYTAGEIQAGRLVDQILNGANSKPASYMSASLFRLPASTGMGLNGSVSSVIELLTTDISPPPIPATA